MSEWILIGLQVVALYGSSLSGDALSVTSVTDIFTLMGYFLPAIIGASLIIREKTPPKFDGSRGRRDRQTAETVTFGG